MRGWSARIDRWLRPRCAVEGCDRRAWHFAQCWECLQEDRRNWAREEARREFEGKVEAHVEALRRFDAEKREGAGRPDVLSLLKEVGFRLQEAARDASGVADEREANDLLMAHVEALRRRVASALSDEDPEPQGDGVRRGRIEWSDADGYRLVVAAHGAVQLHGPGGAVIGVTVPANVRHGVAAIWAPPPPMKELKRQRDEANVARDVVARERDEARDELAKARAEIERLDAINDRRELRSSGALGAERERADRAERQRDEARAEVERLRRDRDQEAKRADAMQRSAEANYEKLRASRPLPAEPSEEALQRGLEILDKAFADDAIHDLDDALGVVRQMANAMYRVDAPYWRDQSSEKES